NPRGDLLAWTSESGIRLAEVEATGEPTVLPAGNAPPVRVAFPQEPPYYRLGLAKGGARGVDRVFDTRLLRLDEPGPSGEQREAVRWLPQDWLSKNWQVRETTADDGTRSVWMFEGDARRARVPLLESRNGAYRASCWIPSRDPQAPPF